MTTDVLAVMTAQTCLVDRLAQFIERFIFIKEKSLYRLLALWVILTHFYKDFEYTGCIYFFSPEPGSGKTRALEVLDLVVSSSSGLLYQPTDAILFRTADGMTQLLDEVDSWSNGESLRGVLNAGFHSGGKVLRNEKRKNGRWEPVPFPVYAPRAMAGIGDGILHKTTKDRTFIIAMNKQTRAERREKFRARNVKSEADQLKKEIEEWVKRHRERVVAFYDNAEVSFFYLAHLRDRTIDIVEPLAAILEVVCESSSDLGARRLELLEAVNTTRTDGGEFVADHRILRELSGLATASEPLIGSASELATRCKLDPNPTEYDIAGTLRRYGFQNRSIRVGDSVRYRYKLRQQKLTDVIARYAEGANASNGSEEPLGSDEK